MATCTRLKPKTEYQRYVDSVIDGADAMPWQVVSAVQMDRDGDIDWEIVERVRNFIGQLRHSLGACAGKPFTLAPWQLWIVAELFGRLDSQGLRQYRRAFISVPRKNGKTTFAAALALYLLLGDGEPGPEIISVAVAREQAYRLVAEVKRMVDAWPRGKRVVKIRHNSVLCPGNNGSLSTASADCKVAWGRNPSAAVVDELHAYSTRDLWDATITATAARQQPLVICTSTVGEDRSTLYTELRSYGESLLRGEEIDPSWLIYISGADPEDDPGDPVTWAKANPNLGISVSKKDMEVQWHEAKSPAAQAAFRRFRLNDPLVQSEGWITKDVWEKTTVPILPDLTGRECTIGLDLSSTTDLTAAVLAFPNPDGSVWVLPQAWCTAESLQRGKRSSLYRQWHAQHAITVCPGKIIDYLAIREWLRAAKERYRIKRIFCDPFNARHLLSELSLDGFSPDILVEHPQFASHVDAPIRETTRLIYAGKLYHPIHPPLTACVMNAQVKVDSAGRQRFDRRYTTGPIDLAVAMIMAVGHVHQVDAVQAPIGIQLI